MKTHHLFEFPLASVSVLLLILLLLRLVSAVLIELSDGWETGKMYLNMDVENDEPASEQQKIYRKKVACSCSMEKSGQDSTEDRLRSI